MPKAAKIKLKWHNDEMEWRNEAGEAVPHPRYQNSPSSLTSRSFLKGYLTAYKAGQSLNDYMKTHGKYSAKDVQKAARYFRSMYEAAAPGKTFKLLRAKKDITAASRLQDQRDALEIVSEMLLGIEKQSRPRKK